MEKKLYRCRSNRIILGVCCGLAHYFDLDPVLVRLLFIVALFIPGLNGAAVLAYLILAIVIPSEGSATATTEQTVKENLNEMRETANDLGDKIRTNLGSTPASDERDQRRNRILTVLGGVLIIAGVLALLSSLNVFWWFRWEFVWPAVLILIGILILVNATRRK